MHASYLWCDVLAVPFALFCHKLDFLAQRHRIVCARPSEYVTRRVLPAADRQRDPRYPGRIVRAEVESSRRYVRWLPYPPERIEGLAIRPVIRLRKPRPRHFSLNDSGR